MSTGKIKWFDVHRGYGFIEPEDGSTDVFVHISTVTRSGLYDLHEGQAVSYDLLEDIGSGKIAASQLKLSTASGSTARSVSPVLQRVSEDGNVISRL